MALLYSWITAFFTISVRGVVSPKKKEKNYTPGDGKNLKSQEAQQKSSKKKKKGGKKKQYDQKGGKKKEDRPEWWTETLTRMKRKAWQARKNHIQQRTEETRIEKNRAEHSYQSELRKARNANWREYWYEEA